MTIIDMAAVMAAAKTDPEFTRETRYLNGKVKFDIADEHHVLTFTDGKLVDHSTNDVPDSQCKIFVRGTREHWEAMARRYPPPFYQSLQSSAVRHNVQLSDTNETFAYLPALNRLMQIVREHSGV